MGPSDGPPGGPKVAQKPDTVPVIYNPIEALPPPREDPMSESISESDSKNENDMNLAILMNPVNLARMTAMNPISAFDDRPSQESTIESESFGSTPSSPKEPDPKSSTHAQRPKPPPFDPRSYISTKDEAAKCEAQSKAQAQSQISSVFKTTTTIWNESVKIES